MNRKLLVVTMIDHVAPSGAELFAARIAARLDPDRFDRVLCVTRPSPGADLAELESAGVELLFLNRGSRVDLWRWLPLLHLLRRRRVDVLHSHKFGSNVWAALLGPLARVPVLVAHEHTWSYEGQPLRRFLDRELVARSADVVLTVSREDRRRMIEIEGVDPGKVRYLRSGIVPPPDSGQPTLRSELGIGPDAPVIGTVCELRPQKALDVLLRAAATLRSVFPELRVLIVGEGAERPKLERLIEELHLDGTVTLLGAREPREVPSFLSGLDVAVSSSDFEGAPLAVMEFMAAGRPVVATRVGGVPDLIEHGVHGLLVPARDPAALAAAVAELLRDPSRRGEMGSRARERQRSELDFDVMVRRLETLYEELRSEAR